jgi:hypothetical protein
MTVWHHVHKTSCLLKTEFLWKARPYWLYIKSKKKLCIKEKNWKRVRPSVAATLWRCGYPFLDMRAELSSSLHKCLRALFRPHKFLHVRTNSHTLPLVAHVSTRGQQFCFRILLLLESVLQKRKVLFRGSV